MNKDSSIGKLFPSFSRYGKCFPGNRTPSKITNHNLFTGIEVFFNFLKEFLFKYCSNECQKFFESFKKIKLKLLGCQAQNLQYNDFQKR